MSITRSWRVGHYWACLTVDAGPTGPALGRITWHPAPPRQWSAQDLEAHARGRNVSLAAICAELGERPILMIAQGVDPS